MTYVLIALAAVVVMGAAYAVVIRGSLGLVKKRLEEDPELAEPVPDSQLDDGLPTDVEY